MRLSRMLKRGLLAGFLVVGAYGCPLDTDDPAGGDVGPSEAMFGIMCQPGVPMACDCPGAPGAGQQVCDGTGGFMPCDCSAAVPSSPTAEMMGAAGGGAPAEPAWPRATGVPEPMEEPAMMAQMPPVTPPTVGPMEPNVSEPMETMDPMETTDPMETMEIGGDEVPASEACADAAGWASEWSAFEQEVLELTNAQRTAGATCGGMSRPAVGPLTMNANLRCSARLHSKDMADLGYFDHTSADGRQFHERISAAGYVGSTMGENIAQGQRSPEQVVQGWMDSPGHCENIMRGGFTEIGIGFYEGEGGSGFRGPRPLYWTQNFGAPGRDWGRR